VQNALVLRSFSVRSLSLLLAATTLAAFDAVISAPTSVSWQAAAPGVPTG